MEMQKLGEAAGRLWRHLADNGSVTLQTLPKTVGTDPATMYMALGWLAREGKVQFDQGRKDLAVRLTEEEFLKAKATAV